MTESDALALRQQFEDSIAAARRQPDKLRRFGRIAGYAAIALLGATTSVAWFASMPHSWHYIVPGLAGVACLVAPFVWKLLRRG